MIDLLTPIGSFSFRSSAAPPHMFSFQRSSGARRRAAFHRLADFQTLTKDIACARNVI